MKQLHVSLALLLLLFQIPFSVYSKGKPVKTDTTKTDSTAALKAAALAAEKKIKVLRPEKAHTISVEKYNGGDTCCLGKPLQQQKLYLDDYIKVKVDSMALHYADSLCLWINHICFKKIRPLYTLSDGSFIYQLTYDTLSSSPWQVFYAYPQYMSCPEHHLQINAGTEKFEFVKLHPGIKNNSTLFTSVQWMRIVAYILFLTIVIIILKLGKALLRDTVWSKKNGIIVSYSAAEPTNSAAKIMNYKDVPYSLSRSQFLFWLFIIFFSLVHIWGSLDTLAEPTGTVLLLLGISGGTFYISSLIDITGKSTDSVPTDDVITATIDATIKRRNAASGSKFMFDILNDGNSISLHRLQLVMFTLFLGLYFVWFVLLTLNMPQFSDTMMTLLGISAATYAGVKTTES